MVRFIGFYDYTVILTYLSLVCAVMGMVLSGQGEFGWAILCLLGSGICDAFDGTVARSKKNRTEDEKAFGIQLDSLCDVVSFGVFPAFWCYSMGVDSVLGLAILCVYCICAVIRLAFFNVMEAKRQKVQSGCNKVYRGLPVTSAAIVYPVVYLLGFVLPRSVFLVVLYLVPTVTAFLFVLDFPVKKPNLSKVCAGK